MALPDDCTLLRRCDAEGLTESDLAAIYSVPVDQISARFAAMNRAIDTAQNRETTELMAAIRHYKATGQGAADAVLRAHRRGWTAERIRSRTGVDIDTVHQILADAA
ncbi:hypothetical protein [Kitasatospora sp. GAS204B]|uniref:hypothetical protein n=1 Tax=unclassified Kitasatospora TaxID=2633591 RepID=UPI002474E8C5|nr:hypothetical protein [Kitasatospora sp. GAS204B]MDH6120439.1 DNA-directed RNA polymerase specialized sigma24 family protein [Kitasatospora sp. GAS204B]